MSNTALMAIDQAKKALSGSWLDDYRQAEHPGSIPTSVLTGPNNMWQAKVLSAYWMGVAARVLRDRSLALAALSEGQNLAIPAVSAANVAIRDPQKVFEQIQGAAGAIQKEAAKGGGAEVNKITGILGILGTWNPSFIANSQRMTPQAQVKQGLKENLTEGADLITKVKDFVVGILTGAQPSYITSKVAWGFAKWGARVVLGAIVLGIAGVAIKPYLAPFQKIYRKVAKRGESSNPELLGSDGDVIADLDGLKLTAPKKNPKFRRKKSRKRKR